MPKRKTAKILPFELPERIGPPCHPEPRHRPDIRMFPSGHRQSGAWTAADMVKAMQGVVQVAAVEGIELPFSCCLRPECLTAYNPNTGEALFTHRDLGAGHIVSAPDRSTRGIIDGLRMRSWYYRAECKVVSWQKAFGGLCTPTPWEKKAFAL